MTGSAYYIANVATVNMRQLLMVNVNYAGRRLKTMTNHDTQSMVQLMRDTETRRRERNRCLKAVEDEDEDDFLNADDISYKNYNSIVRSIFRAVKMNIRNRILEGEK